MKKYEALIEKCRELFFVFEEFAKKEIKIKSCIFILREIKLEKGNQDFTGVEEEKEVKVRLDNVIKEKVEFIKYARFLKKEVKDLLEDEDDLKQLLEFNNVDVDKLLKWNKEEVRKVFKM